MEKSGFQKNYEVILDTFLQGQSSRFRARVAKGRPVTVSVAVSVTVSLTIHRKDHGKHTGEVDMFTKISTEQSLDLSTEHYSILSTKQSLEMSTEQSLDLSKEHY